MANQNTGKWESGKGTSSSFSPARKRMGVVSCETISLLRHWLRERNLNGPSQRKTCTYVRSPDAEESGQHRGTEKGAQAAGVEAYHIDHIRNGGERVLHNHPGLAGGPGGGGGRRVPLRLGQGGMGTLS
jgi:hypothetical protein